MGTWESIAVDGLWCSSGANCDDDGLVVAGAVGVVGGDGDDDGQRVCCYCCCCCCSSGAATWVWRTVSVFVEDGTCSLDALSCVGH